MDKNPTCNVEVIFRRHIEGVIPDLCCTDGNDPDEEDFESILDYALDRSCDEFPQMDSEERRAMCVRVAKYFTGGGA